MGTLQQVEWYLVICPDEPFTQHFPCLPSIPERHLKTP